MLPLTLSHYRIESELGRGGMGVVYQAFDTRLQRPVALKVLLDEIAADPVRRVSVLEEARAASALNHPAITTIHEVGEHDQMLFIVMELVAGRTLRQILSTAALEVRPLLDIAIQIAEALAAAHARGVVHGDIKPENVMVRADGRVKLLDFGIARRCAIDSAAVTGLLAEDGATIGSTTPRQAGTVPYMAPELVNGTGGDQRIDLFALGVVLYEAIAGRRPFHGPTTLALVHHLLHHDPDVLGTIVPDVPENLARVVHKMLEKEPARRTQTAMAAATDLNAVLRDLDLAEMLPTAVAGKRSVAVLPFRLLTPDPSDAYLGAALADSVVVHLGEGGSLLVRPTSAVMRYASGLTDPLLAGRELNVDVIVDGSVQRLDRRLRVHVQARLVHTGELLSSTRHEADTSDLFGLQDDVAESLGRGLGVSAARGASGPSKPPTANAKSYELFLRASERLVTFNRWDTRSAIDMLEGATRLDPTFADAWARLGEARVIMQQSFEPDGKWIPDAQRAIRRALQLNPQNALAHSSRARVLWTPENGFKVGPALRSTTAALRLNASCHPAWVFQGILLYHVSLQHEARAALTSALASHPNDPVALSFLGQTFFEDRDYERAVSFTERALAIDRGGFYANLFRPMMPIYRHQHSEADRCIRESRHAVGADPMLLAYDALLHAKEGRSAKARAAIAKALAGRSLVHSHHTFHLVAAAQVVLGEKARGVAMLRKAGCSGFPNHEGFRNDPHFASLHDYPPFLRLMAGLKRDVARHRREFSATQRASS